MQVTRDKKGVHIHLSRLSSLLFGGLIGLAIMAAVASVAWYYYNNYYDTSTSSKELTDLNPPTPSPGINKVLQHISQQGAQSPSVNDVSAHIKVPILMYHYVEYVQDKNDKIRISLTTTPYILEEQIKTLISGGYTFLTAKDLSDIMDKKASLPANPIILTFDDSYTDFYTDAYPILKKYHVKATQYVITGFLNRKNHMTPSQVQQVAADGLVELGAHTTRHTWLRGLSLSKASLEIFQSKIALEQLINVPVVSFAYPFGAFDTQTAEIVQSAGYKTAVSTLPGVIQSQDNRFFLFRVRPGGRTGSALLFWLSQQK